MKMKIKDDDDNMACDPSKFSAVKVIQRGNTNQNANFASAGMERYGSRGAVEDIVILIVMNMSFLRRCSQMGAMETVSSVEFQEKRQKPRKTLQKN